MKCLQNNSIKINKEFTSFFFLIANHFAKGQLMCDSKIFVTILFIKYNDDTTDILNTYNIKY